MPKIECVADNTVQMWKKVGLLHREDGPAVIRGSGDLEVREFWLDGCLMTEAMLELHKTLAREIDGIVQDRKVVELDAMRTKK